MNSFLRKYYNFLWNFKFVIFYFILNFIYSLYFFFDDKKFRRDSAPVPHQGQGTAPGSMSTYWGLTRSLTKGVPTTTTGIEHTSNGDLRDRLPKESQRQQRRSNPRPKGLVLDPLSSEPTQIGYLFSS